MIPIARELESARQRLLDLTLRNRLLNYRPSALRSIRVIGELPAEIYDALVLREKALEFRGTTKGAAMHDDTWAAQTTLESRHTDRFLQTPYDEESLAKKLFRVYHEDAARWKSRATPSRIWPSAFWNGSRTTKVMRRGGRR